MTLIKRGILWLVQIITLLTDVDGFVRDKMYESVGYNCPSNFFTKEYERPGLNLCQNDKKIFNCTNQVASVYPETRCEMKVIDPKECTDELFKGETDKTAIESVGTIKLTPYLHCEYMLYTSFNITLPNTPWRRIKMRYIEEGKSTGRNCREFELSGNEITSTSISYDCLFDKNMGGKNYRLQYLITTNNGKDLLNSYLFKAPLAKNMNSFDKTLYHIFMVIDEMDHSLKVQVPPKIFNVSRINITLYYKEDIYSEVKVVSIESLDVSDEEEKDYISLFQPLDSMSSGCYYFNATFYSSYCGNSCQASVTPDVCIKGWGKVSEVLAAAFLITVMVSLLIIYLTWKSKYREVSQGPEKPPNVLLIYESTFPALIEDVYKIKEYLEDNCFVNVNLDLIDIPRTDSKDPWEWYVKAFERADNVLVFASPSGDVEKGLHRDNVYHNLHVYAYKLLIFYLLHKNKCSKVAGVRLPGCSWDTLPPEAQIINRNFRFALPDQLTELLKFLNVPQVMDGASKLSTALMSPRNPQTLVISKPTTPLRYPDIDEEDNEIRLQLPALDGTLLNFDGTVSSESEEEDDDDESRILEGFIL